MKTYKRRAEERVSSVFLDMLRDVEGLDCVREGKVSGRERVCVCKGRDLALQARKGRTYIIPAQHTNDFPATVQLDKETLVEVLVDAKFG